MERKNVFLTAACVLVPLLTGCGEESFLESTDRALRLQSVQVAEDNTYTGNTRAGALGATPMTKIGVYVTADNHSALAENAKSVFELKSGTWSSTTPPKIDAVETTPDRVYAFFPSEGEVTNGGSANHTILVQVVADNFLSVQTDYLYATPATVHAGSRAVAFTMNHALSKVSFKILKSASVSEKLTLTKIEVLSGTNRLQLGTNGTMNLSTGKLNGLAATGSLILTGSTVLNTLQEQPNVSCLVAPMTALETKLYFRLSVRVAGEDKDRIFETATVGGDGVQWEAGYHYVYKMTVNKMSGSLNGIMIDGWKNDANQNTGIGI